MVLKEIEADVFDNLEWENIDGMELDKMIEGLTVIGAEPVDYPATDGVIIYLQGKNKHIIAIEIETGVVHSGKSLDFISDEDDIFSIRKAVVPFMKNRADKK